MRSFYIISLFCLITVAVSAQTQDTTISMKNRTEEYCMVLAVQKLLSYKVTIQIDYGQHRNIWKDERLTDSTGQVRIFETVIDALNYLNSLGWEFVDAYVITVSGQSIHHYMMRRKIIQ